MTRTVMSSAQPYILEEVLVEVYGSAPKYFDNSKTND
jgi:hypothetical protein